MTGRRRAHRAPGQGAPDRGLLRRPRPGRLRRPPRARRRPLRRDGDAHGQRRLARDYLLLEYRGGDKLYVPSDQIDALTPYSGGEPPALNRLGGGEWQRQKAKARPRCSEIAQELVVLYRRRLVVPGHAFAPDTPWQPELEQAFPYPETPDQLTAIDDVKADMEAPTPMDRLVCGDVGFGKTEVAVRAVFKAVQDGKQAAVLVRRRCSPQQHSQTFADRYARSRAGRDALALPHARPRRRRSSPASPTGRSTS